MERNSSRLIGLIATTTAVCLFCTSAFANPQGGVVSVGQASITSAGNRVDVHQASDRALIDWRSFDIAPGEVTQFHQPSATSLTVNRVNAATPSQIDGRLQANGNLVLINPNGIVFGQGSAVDVNGLVATTSQFDESTLHAEKLEFRTPGNPDARVVNEGVITAKDAGLVGLVAPHVANNGIIDARLGRVQLASGDTFTLDLYGDGLVNLAVSDPVKQQLVSNSGLIRADGGTVSMTAAAGKDVVNSVINMDGVIQARSIGEKNGKIVLFAEGSNAVKGNMASDKGKKQGHSTVLVSGVLDASGTNPITTRPTAGVKGTKGQTVTKGERGGSIDVFGDRIGILNGAVFDVSGLTGEINTTAGGSIRIGGDYLGQGEAPAAQSLFVDTYSLFYADALHTGDAGRAIFWSDGDTDFRGTVYARGGRFGGNGGFVETSGKETLRVTGLADMTASQGATGEWLLDPADITLLNRSGSGDLVNTFTTAQIEAMSIGADVSLLADNSITLDLQGDTLALADDRSLSLTTTNGDITFVSVGTITTNRKSTGGNITLEAGNTISIDRDFGFHTMNAGTVTLNAAEDIVFSGRVDTDYLSGPFTARAGTDGTGDITVNAQINGNQSVNLYAGTDITLNQDVRGSTDIRLWAAGGNPDGVGRINLNGGKLDFANGPYWVIDMISGNNGGRPDFVYDGGGTHVVNNTGPGAIFKVIGFNDININKPVTTSVFTRFNAYNLLDINESLTSTYVNGYEMYLRGANGIRLGADVSQPNGGQFYAEGPVTVEGNRTITNGVTVLGTNGSQINGTIDGSAPGASLVISAGVTLLQVGGTVGGTTPLGNLSITADGIHLGADLFGTGVLSLQPFSPSQNVNINAGPTGFALDATEIGRIQSGWSGVTIGRADAGGATTIGAATWNAPVTVRSLTGNISVTGTQTLGGDSLLLTTAGGSGDISVSASITGTGTGTTFTAITGDLFDGTGGSFNGTGGGRFLIYAPSQASLTSGGFANDFRRFSCTYGGSCPPLGTGNGFLYSTTPVLDVTPSALSAIVAGSPIPNLIGYAYTLAGYLGGDAAADAVAGSLTGSTTYTTASTPGTYAVNHAGGTLVSALGYAFNYLGNATAITVDAAPPSGPGNTGATVTPPPPPTPAPMPPVTVLPPAPTPPQAPATPPVSPALPSTIVQAVTRPPSSIPDVNCPAPASTLTAELRGEDIVLTPTNRNDPGGTETEGQRNERGESVPCPSSSPYDPSCHSAAAAR